MERAYILGHPVSHSKSPAMHNAAYKALGIDWEYGFADREAEPDARATMAPVISEPPREKVRTVPSGFAP